MPTPAPSADGFQAAWEHARQAGLPRPFLTARPDPALARVDPTSAWLLARALAEAEGFQQALGEWVDTPAPTPAELSQALAGLRRAQSGPAWWRRLWAPVRAMDLARWRSDLDTAAQAAATELARVAHAQQAREKMAGALEEWGGWARNSLPAESLGGFTSRQSLLAATLGLMAQRLAARHVLAQQHLAGVEQARPLLEAVRQVGQAASTPPR